jgi:Pyruvate/2-oxoacid:ferredoxin oxidoreductase delta subunit
MCRLCIQHAGRDEAWYLNFENYLFKKIFPTPEEQEEAKQAMIATFAETEWRYSEKEYVRNPQFLQARASSGFGAQVVTLEETLKILEIAEEATRRDDSMLVVGHCPCKLVYRGARDYVCIGFGFPVTMSMEVAYGRLPREGLTEFGGAEWRQLRKELRKEAKVPLKLAEAEKLLLEWERKGLWHLIMGRGRLPLIEAICNCERPYCVYWRWRDVYGIPDYCLKGHYVARIRSEECTSCGECMQQCQFGAVRTSVWDRSTAVDPTKCFGCGLCRIVCDSGAIEMIPRESIPVARNLW